MPTKAELEQRCAELEAQLEVQASGGSVARQVGEVVARVVTSEAATEVDRSRCEMAMNLARELDSPSGERPSPAQVTKELGNVLDRLEKFCRDDSREGLFT